MNKELEQEEIVVEKKSIGEVKIASEVVAVIAGLAANEVEGVHSMAGSSVSLAERICQKVSKSFYRVIRFM